MTGTRRSLSDDALASALADLRDELEVPGGFPDAVRAEAEASASAGPAYERTDARDIPFLTIDPPGSLDLDQALHVEAAADGGHLVRYAIADVAAFVTPGGAVDEEAWHRGVSRYSPDLVTPLHPPELSEGAASLLPGEDRPAVLWTLRIDEVGDLVSTEVGRATVRSRRQLTYADAQVAIDGGADPVLVALSVVGRRRAEREWVRGGVSLDLPDQEVHTTGDGQVELVLRAPLPVEGWNAQISLLTGIAAGEMMATAGVGVLRTLPAPTDAAIDGLRRRAWALGLPWPEEVSYAAFVRTLDPHDGVQAAMISTAAVGLRGAGYVAFADGPPPDHRHEALAATYAHVTAPLRRLVDRYATEVVLAVADGRPVPPWVLERLDALPSAMASARGRASGLDRAVIDLVEAHLLRDRVGEVFAGTVVGSDDDRSTVQLRDPAMAIRVDHALPLGAEVSCTLQAVDVAARTLTFTATETT